MTVIGSINGSDAQVSEIGGKAKNLFVLKSLGLPVPEFVVIPVSLLQADSGKEDFSLPDSLIEKVFSKLPAADYYAVRSSAQNEDGTASSYAGLYETLLYQPKSELKSAIEKVWMSVVNKRIEVYNQAKNSSGGTEIAIIIQCMIDSEKSGVAFGINPLTSNRDEKVVNAVWGLGEGLVSGELNADMFVVNNGNCTLSLAEKEFKMVLDKDLGKGLQKIALSPEDSASVCLKESEIIEICEVLTRLEKHFGIPQDIEFAFQNNKLYLLQTRPVTTISLPNQPKSQQTETIWDNSNIIESYPGITSPLTFSFILKMYEAVYRQLSLILGITLSKVEENKEVYANMLGHLWGRVYYNLNHWHKTLSLLPGYNLNASFMDSMMGVKEQFDITQIKQENKLKAWGSVARAVIQILYTHSRLNKDRIAFQKYFNAVMEKYEAFDFEKMDTQELIFRYFEFEETLVKKWKAPLVNDFFCMIYFGLLQKLVVKYKLDESGTLHNDLVSGAKDIISTEPIDMTLKIVDDIRKNDAAQNLFTEKSTVEIEAALETEAFAEIKKAIDKYIKKWGERCVGELKLETITYKQEPKNYLKILKSYIINGVTSSHSIESSIREDAVKIVNQKLKNSFFKKRMFAYVLKKARYLVSNRENLRFERTRGFGMVRIIMCEIGKKLALMQVIEKEEDVFYLEQNEIFNFIKGTSSDTNLKGLIAFRKQEFVKFEELEIPERIRSKGSVYLEKIVSKNNIEVPQEDVLQGIGCSAGKVRGKAVVILSPHETESVNGGILITASTDPGWVVLFPSASAIVVERGSLLSHSAIVSREMGIPCVVGVKGLLKQISTGDLIEMDGSTGEVIILERYGKS
jgi:rifampicin phosphotransferase